MRTTILLIIVFFSFRFVEGQTVDAIRFVSRCRPDLTWPTLSICIGKLVQPDDAYSTDSLMGSAILTDAKTYNWVREYILSSFYTYTAEDAKKAIQNGKPMCLFNEWALEIKDSLGMDLFVCRNNWNVFFDTLRSELQLHQMDKAVIDAFKSPPHWPETPTRTAKWTKGKYSNK
jgi:hypothetical protein